MAAERRVIDLEDIPGGDGLAEVLDRYPEGFVLRRGGRPVGQFRDDPASVPPEIEELMDAIPVLTAEDVERLRNEPMSPERRARLIELGGAPYPGWADEMHRIVDEGRQESIRRQLDQDDPAYISPEIRALIDAIPVLTAEDVERLKGQPMSPERRARLIELSGPPNPEQAERMHRIVEENRQTSIRRQLEEIERERS